MPEDNNPDWISKEAYRQLQSISSQNDSLQNQINELKRKHTTHYLILGVAALCLGIGGWQGLSVAVRNKVPQAVEKELKESEAGGAVNRIIKMERDAKLKLAEIESIRSSISWTEVTKGPFQLSHEYVLIREPHIHHATRVDPLSIDFTYDTRKCHRVFASTDPETIYVRHLSYEDESTPRDEKGWRLYSRPASIQFP
ncbi:MAG: hypothetical protein AAGH99_01135 [Planctomycetota bacterium]